MAAVQLQLARNRNFMLLKLRNANLLIAIAQKYVDVPGCFSFGAVFSYYGLCLSHYSCFYMTDVSEDKET